ncbi:cell division control protein 2 homolog, partial [Prosopis cineraria]|uniref:cell division control protein 2 homolog n=1 Tax=Prosopis cineraria TaxID=364024 RepID=UPI00240F7CCF
MTFNMEIKLADIGFAGSFGDPWTTYPCPELPLDHVDIQRQLICGSVGCIFGEMITGKPVFQGKTQMDQLKSIFRLLGTRTEESWPRVTDEYAKMLCLDPRKRISAANALQHDYFKDFNQRG